MANRLCAVLPVAENGDMGDHLGRAGTALYTRTTTTVVLGLKQRRKSGRIKRITEALSLVPCIYAASASGNLLCLLNLGIYQFDDRHRCGITGAVAQT
jgi:hypothetical protein